MTTQSFDVGSEIYFDFQNGGGNMLLVGTVDRPVDRKGYVKVYVTHHMTYGRKWKMLRNPHYIRVHIDQVR